MALRNPAPTVQKLMPDIALTETFPRRGATFTGIPLTAQRLTMTAVHLDAGTVVTGLRFWNSSPTAAATPAHAWAGLFDFSRVPLVQSADDVAFVWNGYGGKSFTMTAPYTVTATGVYYLGLLVDAGTMPIIAGVTAGASRGPNNQAPQLGGDSSTGITATAPNPAAALSTTNPHQMYACVL